MTVMISYCIHNRWGGGKGLRWVEGPEHDRRGVCVGGCGGGGAREGGDTVCVFIRPLFVICQYGNDEATINHSL